MARQEMITLRRPELDAKIRVLGAQMPHAVERGLEAGVRAATIMLAGEVQDLLEGPVLNRRTGKLWRSFSNPKVRKKGGRHEGIVGTNLEYAAIHEFGGVIRPKAANALRFKIGSSTVFAQRVEIPRRPFVSRAFKENADRVSRMIGEQIDRSVRSVMGE